MNNWYSDPSSQKEIAVSTRIRLARNLKELPFPSGMTDKMRIELKERVKNAVKENDFSFAGNLKFIDMADVPETEIGAMVERHIISPEFAKFTSGRAILISEDESVCVMIGEEDHIRIQVILPGLQLENAYATAQKIDSVLNATLHFAFDSELGFLTECPTNLGTGLRASVMLHLPLLEAGGQLRVLGETVNKLGFTVRGIFGEGSKAKGSLYQISNQITLGISESEAIDNLIAVANQIIEKEKVCEEKLEKISTEDKIFRALGTLKYARVLESREMINLLSLIKLGLRMGIIKEEFRPIELLVAAGPNMLMKKYGVISAEERDIKRAEFIREKF